MHLMRYADRSGDHYVGLLDPGGELRALPGVRRMADLLSSSAAHFGRTLTEAARRPVSHQLNNVVPLLPVLIGMFAGAPLVARELEGRTFRYAWTQGVSRRRWLTTKVLLLGAVIVLLSAASAGVHLWWFAPSPPHCIRKLARLPGSQTAPATV